jgi:RNA polymerase sigma-70 factor (ECF subfamily)
MQEAYVRAYQKLAQFEHRAAFCTWITRIAIHEALARMERHRKFMSDESRKGGTLAGLQSQELSPEASMAKTEMRELLEQAILALPFPYRTVIMLRDVEEMSTAEAANALDLTEEAVKVRLHRGRAMLRKELFVRAGATSASAFQFHAARCDRVTAQVCTRIADIVRE